MLFIVFRTSALLDEERMTQSLGVTSSVEPTSAVVDIYYWIIIGSDRRPETKQGIEGKIDRFRSGRVRDRDSVRVRFRSSI